MIGDGYTQWQTCIKPIMVISPPFAIAYSFTFSQSNRSPAWLDSIAITYFSDIIAGLVFATLSFTGIHFLPDGVHPTFYLYYFWHQMLTLSFLEPAVISSVVSYFI